MASVSGPASTPVSFRPNTSCSGFHEETIHLRPMTHEPVSTDTDDGLGTDNMSARSLTDTTRGIPTIEPTQDQRPTDCSLLLQPHDPSDSIKSNSLREPSSHNARRRGLLGGKTVVTVVTLFLIAMSCGISHYVFFTQLNNKLASGPDAHIRQSYATVLSLLLATSFRAATLGSVGICFAQILWQRLRGDSTSIRNIERFFQMRTNLFELAHPSVIKHGTVLFLVALYMWMVPLAVTFPPTALTIASVPLYTTETHNISVINPPIEEDLSPRDPWQWWNFGNVFVHENNDGSMYYVFDAPLDLSPLMGLSKSVSMRGDISDTQPPSPGRNSSHELRFMGPQWRCNRNETKTLVAHDNSTINVPQLSIVQGARERDLENMFSFTVEITKLVGAIGCNLEGGSKNVTQLGLEITTLSCYERQVTYSTRIDFVDGIRNITNKIIDNVEPQPKNIREMTVQAGLNWTDELRGRIEHWNSLALLEYFVSAFVENKTCKCQCAGYWTNPPVKDSSPISWKYGNNSTVVLLDPVQCRQNYDGPSNYPLISTTPLLLDSRLNPNRFAIVSSEMAGLDARDLYNPLHTTVTEASLNELLANITISSMSLGAWYRPVSVNVSEFQNVFHFSRPINLILPYTLCLGIGLVILALGLISLLQNEVSVADGGFVQIMMATRGGTRMEEIVVDQGLTGPETIPEELKALKVRYGELIDTYTGTGSLKKRYGFGTDEETTPLRKRDGQRNVLY